MNPINIVGFTPLGVILAERLTYSLDNKLKHRSNVSLIERSSSRLVDNHWQSVSLLCLLNLLKQCRMLQVNAQNKFGINVQKIKMNKRTLYAFIQLATQRVQKYYLTLLKQRRVHFKLFSTELDNSEIFKDILSDKQEYVHENTIESIEQLTNNDEFQLASKKIWQTYFKPSDASSLSHADENSMTHITYNSSSYRDFDQSPRINAFHAIFQYLLSRPSLKFIGSDVFSFEFACLLSALGQNEIYFYRMNSNDTPLISVTETNTDLVVLFQVFYKFTHRSVIEKISVEHLQPILHIVEQYQNFKLIVNSNGKLTYEKRTESLIPLPHQTPEETKKHKRAYLETFKQRTQESFTKFSKSNVRIASQDMSTEMKEEQLDDFSPSSTFFVLVDSSTTLSNSQICATQCVEGIHTFNCTPSAMILDVYETLRRISNDENVLELKNIFLSIDHELCILQNQKPIKTNQFGVDKILQSKQHDLHEHVENLHDLHKIIQRPIDKLDQCVLYESQLFQNDSLDLQSLILLFNLKEEIPKNELLFLFYDDQTWHHLLKLPDQMVPKNSD